MSQRQELIQTQKQVQQQRLTQQQMLVVRMLEMPLNELEESVGAEIDDNPALETASAEDDYTMEESGDMGGNEVDGELQERKDALDDALSQIGSDDEMPTATSYMSHDNADYEEMVYGDTTSFYDKLKEQMAMEDLSDVEQDVMEYLIGSLDDDGLLRKPIDAIADELAVYHNIEVSAETIERVLQRLQTFDPAGIGARSLQECLLLQIERRPDGRLKELMHEVIAHYFTAFTHKHWDKIQQEMQLTDLQTRMLREEIVKLNPKPGASLGETEGRSTQQITPDFIVETLDDGTITFTLNRGNVPELKVSPSFTEMVEAYRNNKGGMNRQEKEALLYAKEKVDRAQGFIAAVKQRQHTLTVTMKAIIDWQRPFFLDGDEGDLRPMILKDIAGKTGLDISTISRVAAVKYAQTKWGTFPLKFFFSDGYTNREGEETSTRRVRLALKELIDNEDKHHPLSDDTLAARMEKMGFPVARRTVAKYRQLMDIPVARLRKL